MHQTYPHYAIIGKQAMIAYQVLGVEVSISDANFVRIHSKCEIVAVPIFYSK